MRKRVEQEARSPTSSAIRLLVDQGRVVTAGGATSDALPRTRRRLRGAPWRRPRDGEQEFRLGRL